MYSALGFVLGRLRRESAQGDARKQRDQATHAHERRVALAVFAKIRFPWR